MFHVKRYIKNVACFEGIPRHGGKTCVVNVSRGTVPGSRFAANVSRETVR